MGTRCDAAMWKVSLTEISIPRNLDVGMQQLLNAQQRELHEWPELFRRADHRFHYVGAYHPEGAIRWIIEAEWQDEEMGGTA